LANSSFSDSSSIEANIFRATFEHDPTPESILTLPKFLTLIPMMKGGNPWDTHRKQCDLVAADAICGQNVFTRWPASLLSGACAIAPRLLNQNVFAH
jgi:hypothetical protein